MVMLGSAKLIVGLLFGAAALAWMQAFPAAILGVFLLIAAISLANASRCWDTPGRIITAAVIILAYLLSGMLVLGFIAGWIAYVLSASKKSRERAADGVSRVAASQDVEN